MKHLKAYAPAVSIFCLALLVRIVYNLTVANGYTSIYDAGVYNILAESLLKLHCYCMRPGQPATFRSPLWPFLVAGMYSLFGEQNGYPRLFYSVLDSGTCVFIYFLAKDLFGKRIALITGLIATIYVGLFVWTGWLYTETLYTFCLTGLVFSLSRLQRTILPEGLRVEKKLGKLLPAWRWAVASGVFLGLVLLARPTGSILIGMLCLWAVILVVCKILPWRPLVKNVLVVLLIALVINLPWLYRNYLVSQTIFPPSSVGTTLQGSYNDAAFQGSGITRGMVLGPPGSLNPDFQRYTKADEQKDTARALNWMHTHVGETFTLLGLHVQNMWTPYLYGFGLPFEEFPNRISSKIMFSLIPMMSIPIFLLAALGFVVTWKRRRKQLLLVYLVIALAILQNMVFYGSPRFRAPIEPLVVLLVGGALWWSLCDEAGMWRRFGHRKKSVPDRLPVLQEV